MTDIGHDDFVAYVGDPDLHDGRIVQLESDGQCAHCLVRGASGRLLKVEFHGVASIESNRPVGMMLYALGEWKHSGPQRKFVFANWDEQDDARLEVVAKGFKCVDAAD